MNKMRITIYGSNFGEYHTDDGKSGIFANVQTLTDYISDGNKCGCSLGKTAVDTANGFAVSKQIQMELEAKKSPVDFVATFGLGVSQGKTTMLIKSVEVPKP